jgi:hypothetical protein
MARQILVNLNNSIGLMVQKINADAAWQGDLDNLNLNLRTLQKDSSVISSLNYLDSQLQTILGDSAHFKYVKIDSADIHELRVDSAKIDRFSFDSAYGGTLIADSITTDFLTVNDSAYIQHLRADSAVIDSAKIHSLSGDSISYKYATFGEINLESDRLIFDEWSITEDSSQASNTLFGKGQGKRLQFNWSGQPRGWFDSEGDLYTQDIVPIFDSSNGYIDPSSQISMQTVGLPNRQWSAMYAINFIGTALRARWADLAENYLCDEELPIGTVVCVGGTKEITKASKETGHSVLGVVSDKPAVLMNQNLLAGKGEYVVPVALKGRVQVKISGNVIKGDRLAANADGVAITDNRKDAWSFGIALEDGNSISGTIEAVIL